MANDYDVSVRRFLELAGCGLGRRVRFARVPTSIASAAFAFVRVAAKALTGGRMSVLNNASLALLTEDNPFTSERARRELGWSPPVRPEDGIPEAFRWWSTNQR